MLQPTGSFSQRANFARRARRRARQVMRRPPSVVRALEIVCRLGRSDAYTGARTRAPKRPVCPADVLPRPCRHRCWESRPVEVVDDVRLPRVVPFRAVVRLLVQPLKGTEQRLVLPLPHIITGTRQDNGLRERALQRLVHIVFRRRGPAERAATPLVVRENAVDRSRDSSEGFDGSLRVDTHGPSIVSLPRAIEILEPG